MRPYVIMADATCDLNEDFQKEYDIQVIPGHVIYPDKTERTSFLKWESEEARARFYAELKKNPEGFSTSPANVAEFAEVFRGQAAQGHDILVLSISGAMSGAYNFMRQARELVLQEYPECRIEYVESRRYGPGFGLMTGQAALRRKEGKSLEENRQLAGGKQEPFPSGRLAGRFVLCSPQGPADACQGLLRNAGRRKADRRI